MFYNKVSFMEICPSQEVFMVFYAIVWGYLSNVQPRWKAFHWPLFIQLFPKWLVYLLKLLIHKDNSQKTALGFRPVYRLILSFVFFNIVPLGYFLLALNWLRAEYDGLTIKFVLCSTLPAMAPFGFYRIWLGIIELWPHKFYLPTSARDDSMLPEWLYVEPTYVTPDRWMSKENPSETEKKKDKDIPVIYLGDQNSGCNNIIAACLYIGAGIIAAYMG